MEPQLLQKFSNNINDTLCVGYLLFLLKIDQVREDRRVVIYK